MDEASAESSFSHHTVTCPICEGPVEVPAHLLGHSVVCPHCQREFIANGPEVNDDHSTFRDSSAPDDLNANRIRKLATLERAANRTASYFVILMLASLAGAAESAFVSISRWQTRATGIRNVGVAGVFLVIGLLLLRLVLMFYRLARSARESSRQVLPAEPLPPPDFSTLQDGSQMAGKLLEMQGEAEARSKDGNPSNPADTK